MQAKQRHLRIETGLSKNPDGTWNGHITLHMPSGATDAYYFPGEPPFKTDREANEWCQHQVKNLCEKIGEKKRTRPTLIEV